MAVSCKTMPKDSFVAESLPPSGGIETVLVLPMNFDHSPNASLQQGLRALEREIESQLSAAGFTLVEPRMSKVMKQWTRLVMQGTGGRSTQSSALSGENYETAREHLARRMLKTHPADMVVMPTLLLREGRYSGSNLRWDSVKRPVVMEERKAGASATPTGKDLGTSIRVTLYDRDGNRVFERYAGLEPIMRYSMNDAYYVHEFRMKSKTRDDLFEDAAIITEGVKLAFEPWLIVEAPSAP